MGFVRLADLHRMYLTLGSRFFDSNIRYGLGEGETVNRAISGALKKIIIEKAEQPSVFALDHNGITSSIPGRGKFPPVMSSSGILPAY